MTQQDMNPDLTEDRETLLGRVYALRDINAILLQKVRDQGSGEAALDQAITDIRFGPWSFPEGHDARTSRSYHAEMDAFLKSAGS